MRIVRTVEEMASLGGGDIGFVPTMGAFHEGHLSLMREARRNHPALCVSLFLNPLQFGRNEDLVQYPRNERRDFELAESERVDLMFAPSAQEVYPDAYHASAPGRRPLTTIHVPDVSELWEGTSRPGHFDGVATVVAKLFNIVQPKTAYFGWKDLQQCVVIRRMVVDLNLPVQLSFLETVRESDGLALSSRNAFLTKEERTRAPMLRTVLLHIAGKLARPGASLEEILADGRSELVRGGFDVDYLELVSMANLQKVESTAGSALIVAAKLGTTRLIDNLQLDRP